MSVRHLKKQLRFAVVLYIAAFALIMYLWQMSSIGSRPTSAWQQSSLLFQSSLVLEETAAYLNYVHSNVRIRRSHPLLVMPEKDDVINAGRSSEDHSLKSRLKSVFNSSLDCPRDFPLTFLGLDSLSVDLGEDPACSWIKNSVINADHNFVGLGSEMAVLRDVTLNQRSFQGRKGGEAISDVFQQNEDIEYFRLQKGFFSLPCNSPPKAVHFHVNKQNYRRNNHLNHWLDSITCKETVKGLLTGKENSSKDIVAGIPSEALNLSLGYVPGITLALQRYEYANLYHTMLDWYNAFLSVLILGIDPSAATVLLVDGHPWGKLDSSWTFMFGGKAVLRAGHLPGETTFQYMVWIPNGYHCPLFNTDRDTVPFLPQLRQYFFKSYGLTPGIPPQCSQLRLLLVRRHDYLAHPRNPKGMLERKIDNEDEIRDALKAAFPQHQVDAKQLDLLPVRQQLQLIGQTDILVGMHGAGLTYTALLATGGALVEMYPKYAGRTSLLFKHLSKWRGVHYVQWMNTDDKNEKANKSTYIPVKVVIGLVQQVLDRMCNNTAS